MSSDQRTFYISDDVKPLSIKGGYFFMGFNPALARADKAFELLQSAVQEVRASKLDITKDAVLQGFRELHSQAGVSNRKHVSSPENLISLILAGRDVPDINPIVNVYNAVSLRTKLALGAHDLTKVHGPIALRRTTGRERFIPLGSDVPKAVGLGEYAYIDEGTNEIICRLETRQCEATKVSAGSANCFFIVQGNAASSVPAIREAITELQRLLAMHCGGLRSDSITWLNA